MLVDTAGQLFRMMPRFRGKARLARLVLAVLGADRVAVIPDRLGNRIKVPNLIEPIAFELWLDGVYEPAVQDVILAASGSGGTILDVGANIGVLSLQIARRLARGTDILAVEASPRVGALLQENIASNETGKVAMIACAAVGTDGVRIPFFDAPPHKFGMGSRTAFFADGATEVAGRTLDSIVAERGISRVPVIKIDVEGHEIDVLAGASRIIASDRPLVVFEFNDWAEDQAPGHRAGDAQAWLIHHGYRVWRLDDFVAGRPPLDAPMTKGSDMLVAAFANAGTALADQH